MSLTLQRNLDYFLASKLFNEYNQQTIKQFIESNEEIRYLQYDEIHTYINSWLDELKSDNDENYNRIQNWAENFMLALNLYITCKEIVFSYNSPLYDI